MDMNLLYALKEKRRELASREGKELFRIFSNETLELTAAARPKTKPELAMIKGWGPKKIASYGDEVLMLIREAGGDNEEMVLPPMETVPNSGRAPAVLSVGMFLQLVNTLFSRMGVIKVRGEISEVSGNGMAFFDLKDKDGADAVAKCFLGRWQYERFQHLLEVGLEVVVVGRPSVYKNGNFRIVAESIEPVGEGALKKAFEALKKKLEAKGYFDEKRKRPMPTIIQRIGVVTSATGAVINDFRRNVGEYGFDIRLADVRVEGDMAEKSIVDGMRWMNMHCPDLDIIVLIRGGGGIESFKAFNTEEVAEAIVTSRIPVITGIGHEKDETIAGYVSDYNVSTPTAVAAFIRKKREELIEHVDGLFQEMTTSMSERLRLYNDTVRLVAERLDTAYTRVLERAAFEVHKYATELARGLERIFSGFRSLEHRFIQAMQIYEQAVVRRMHVVALSEERLTRSMQESIHGAKKQLDVLEAGLIPLDPTAVLNRGYSMVTSSSGHIVKDAGQLSIGERVSVRFMRGSVESRVEKIDI